MKPKTYFITGGLGFIGAHFVHHLHNTNPLARIVVIDKNTYAAKPERITQLIEKGRVFLEETDIADQKHIQGLFLKYQPEGVINFAAESHVDNSIQGPTVFLETNVKGTFTLLEEARKLWMAGINEIKPDFKSATFYQISTDEVFGSLGNEGYFNEKSNYAPSSPYSASKASADHWVKSYYHTYGLPVLLSYCSNNFGPHQHAEKLIPTIINKALNHQPIPIYGSGKNIRDWLYVEDHCVAIACVLEKGKKGGSYAIGASNEQSNLSICHFVLTCLDQIHPRKDGTSYSSQITFVADRPGHDFRYAIDASKIKTELKWLPKVSFEKAIETTVTHYLDQYLYQKSQ